MEALDRLFRPRSIAVIGASADPKKLTGRPIAYLQKHGFAGTILPVNPRYPSISGLPCYPGIGSLPTVPDVGLVLLGGDHVLEAVHQLAKAGAGAAIVLAAGFGEAGAEGQQRQQALKEAAGSMRLLGPNTIGLINVTDRIMLSASGALELEEFPQGNIALVSQSGGILGSLLSRAVGRGIGFSKLIATGNEADLDVSDLVDHLLEDEATAVIALYLEALRKPDRFRTVATKAARMGKPIVAFKVGRSEAGSRSAASHTGALAGADRVYDALFRQIGVIRASTFADLLDIPAALAPRRRLQGRRIAVLTSTGGAATLVADSAGLAGFETPPPDEATAERLRGLNIRDAVLDRNPIDVTLAGLRPDLFRSAIGTLLQSPTYDAVTVIVGSSGLSQPDLVAGPVTEALSQSDKPLLVFVSPEAPGILRHLNRNGVPAFAAPESCAAVLSAMLNVGAAMGQDGAEAELATGPAPDVTDLGSGSLNEAESKALFARFGVPVARETAAATPAEAEEVARQLGGPVVLKILSRYILHKTEVGGVAVNVKPEEVARRCEAMAAAVKRATEKEIEGFLVQELVQGGTELILGFHRDPQLGPIILLGMGGVTTELFKDTAIRLPPIGRRDAASMVDELKSGVLLKGFRGRPRGDLDALASTIMAFSGMALTLGERLVEAEINPLFVLSEGQGVRAADGLVVLR
jgi:acyl-CoA synthetase (NDP forming)